LARRLVVEIVGDSRSFERSLQRSERSARQFQATITKTGRGLNRVFAGAGAGFLGGLGFKSAISAASDLSEQMSKNQQVFGESAREVEAWSRTTAQAFGISQRQALATASSFGALFAPMGLVGDKAAEQSRALTELGADLASFYNTDVQDALDAIRSGVVGESEPLRRYGVLLSETRVQAAALAATHKESAKQLTAAEKAAARIAIIFRDTDKAQGDFARTSDDLANQSRELNAQLDDMKTKLGQLWTPGATKILAAANAELETFTNNAQEMADAQASSRVQIALIPRLAAEYGRLRAQGVSAGDAIKRLVDEMGGTGKAQLLVGDAINYWANGATVAKIARINQEVHHLGAEAEASAKAMAGLAHSTAAVAAADAAAIAAGPHGLAALGPGQRAALGLAAAGRTTSTADNLQALYEQRRVLARQIEFITKKLSGATGGTASNLADTLQGLYDKDAAAFAQITAIHQQAAAETAAHAAAIAAAADKRKQAQQEAIENMFGWLQLGIERADLTKTSSDNIRAWKRYQAAIKEQIKIQGNTLDLARELLRTQLALQDLGKKAADVDPLAGLMQVSSRQLANILAAGTGLGARGRGILGANVAGLEMRPMYVGVNIDGREVGRAVTRDQSRTGRRTARQTSGFRG